LVSGMSFINDQIKIWDTNNPKLIVKNKKYHKK
jgi:hypothetical protein